MFEQFTDCVLRIMKLANDEAQRLHHEYIGTEHILIGLVKEGTGAGAKVLKNFGVDKLKVLAEVEKLIRTGPNMMTMGKLPQTPRAKKVIEYAIEEARNLGHNYVGSEHLLLGLLREADSTASSVLAKFGVTLDTARAGVREIRRDAPNADVPAADLISPPASSRSYERFTDRARKVMALANQEAQRFHHEYIGTEHILLGLVKEGSGVGANVLRNFGVDLRKVRLEVELLQKNGPDMVTVGKLPSTPRAKKVIEYAIGEARNLGHNYVGPEHLLLGLLRERDGVAAAVLVNMGLDLDKVREEVLNLFGTSQPAGLQASPPRIASIELPPNATASIREVLQQANEEAYRLGHTFVGTAHLLLAVVKQKRGAAIDVLRNLEVDLVTMRLQLDDILEPGPDDAMEIVHVIGNESDKPPELPVSPSLRDVLHLASVEAHRLNHNYVGTEHLLLGMLNAGRGPAAVVLRECSVTLEAVRSAVKNTLDR